MSYAASTSRARDVHLDGSGELLEGDRVGRFVVLRDVDGRVHAVAAGSIGAVCETDDGSMLLLPGGRIVMVHQPLGTVLAWLDGRGPR